MKYVIHDAVTGLIRRHGICHPDEVAHQEVPAGHVVLTLPDDHAPIDDRIHQVSVGPSGSGVIVARSASAPDPVMALRSLRRGRDHRLAASDWTQLPDVPLPTQTRVRWAVYRQQLRDLPATTQDPAKPTWPDAPQRNPA